MAISDKLTYLNETKTLLKNKINITGANITNDTFRQYPTKLQNALLNCWNNEGEPIFTNWGTKVNGEGTNVKLDNTINARMKITPKGNTSQEGTPTPTSPIDVNVVTGDNTINIVGKNWLNINGKIVKRESASYSNISTTDNTLSYNITTAIAGYLGFVVRLIIGEQYTLSFNLSNGSIYSILLDDLITEVGTNYGQPRTSGYTFTATKPYVGVWLIANTDGGSYASVSNLMIEKGSTATTYTPYQSQSYPLNLGVENLFDKSTATSQVGYFTSNGTLNGGGSSTVITSYIPIQPNTQYYLNGNALENVCYYDENKTFIERITTNPRSIYKNAYFIRLQFTTSSFNLDTIELTKGSSPQYISNTPIELCKIGTYQDYIYKDSDKWYLHKEIGKITLNGSETDFSYTNGVYYSNTYMTTNYINTALYSNYFVYGGTGYNTSSAYSNGNNVISLHNSDKKTIYMRNDSLTSLANWQSWLSSHNTSIYFILQTLTDTQITDTNLISQLEAIKGAMSYEGQTNINGGFMIVGASALGELE